MSLSPRWNDLALKCACPDLHADWVPPMGELKLGLTRGGVLKSIFAASTNASRFW